MALLTYPEMSDIMIFELFDVLLILRIIPPSAASPTIVFNKYHLLIPQKK